MTHTVSLIFSFHICACAHTPMNNERQSCEETKPSGAWLSSVVLFYLQAQSRRTQKGSADNAAITLSLPSHANAGVTLEWIHCGSPEDPPGVRAYPWGIHRGSTGDSLQCDTGIKGETFFIHSRPRENSHLALALIEF